MQACSAVSWKESKLMTRARNQSFPGWEALGRQVGAGLREGVSAIADGATVVYDTTVTVVDRLWRWVKRLGITILIVSIIYGAILLITPLISQEVARVVIPIATLTWFGIFLVLIAPIMIFLPIILWGPIGKLLAKMGFSTGNPFRRVAGALGVIAFIAFALTLIPLDVDWKLALSLICGTLCLIFCWISKERLGPLGIIAAIAITVIIAILFYGGRTAAKNQVSGALNSGITITPPTDGGSLGLAKGELAEFLSHFPGSGQTSTAQIIQVCDDAKTKPGIGMSNLPPGSIIGYTDPLEKRCYGPIVTVPKDFDDGFCITAADPAEDSLGGTITFAFINSADTVVSGPYSLTNFHLEGAGISRRFRLEGKTGPSGLLLWAKKGGIGCLDDPKRPTA